MWKKYNKYRVLKPFFDNPHPKGIGFQLRELSRILKLAPKSVSIYLKDLEKDGMVLKAKHRIHGYPVYYANTENEFFKLYKRMDMVASIHESGLIDYLEDKIMPESIILFGSAARGEDNAESDLDIFIEAKENDIDIEKFERILKRRINLLFSQKFKALSNELKNNIINGIKLGGYLKAY